MSRREQRRAWVLSRASPRRVPEAARTRILELAEAAYFDVNDSHLAEREGIEVSRVTLRRLLRDAGRSPRRRRRAPRHRRRRDRMPREGMLLQTDGAGSSRARSFTPRSRNERQGGQIH